MLISGESECNGAVYQYTFTVTDDCGKTATCTQDVTLNFGGPSITCPADVRGLTCNSTLPVPNPSAVTATSPCGDDINITVVWVSDSGNPANLDFCSDNDGLFIERIYRATDDCNRSIECTQRFYYDPEVVTFVPCNDDNACTFNDHVGIITCMGEEIVCEPCSGTERCRPFWCDDGNPCTFNDRVMIGCDGEICEPCMGTMEVADKDGDGYRDCEDLCPHDPNKGEPGACAVVIQIRIAMAMVRLTV